MGCGCNRALASSTPQNPIVFGNRSPLSPVVQVTPTVGFGAGRVTIAKGQKVWVSGSSVQDLIDKGKFILLQTFEG